MKKFNQIDRRLVQPKVQKTFQYKNPPPSIKSLHPPDQTKRWSIPIKRGVKAREWDIPFQLDKFLMKNFISSKTKFA